MKILEIQKRISYYDSLSEAAFKEKRFSDYIKYDGEAQHWRYVLESKNQYKEKQRAVYASEYTTPLK